MSYLTNIFPFCLCIHPTVLFWRQFFFFPLRPNAVILPLRTNPAQDFIIQRECFLITKLFPISLPSPRFFGTKNVFSAFLRQFFMRWSWWSLKLNKYKCRYRKQKLPTCWRSFRENLWNFNECELNLEKRQYFSEVDTVVTGCRSAKSVNKISTL